MNLICLFRIHSSFVIWALNSTLHKNSLGVQKYCAPISHRGFPSHFNSTSQLNKIFRYATESIYMFALNKLWNHISPHKCTCLTSIIHPLSAREFYFSLLINAPLWSNFRCKNHSDTAKSQEAGWQRKIEGMTIPSLWETCSVGAVMIFLHHAAEVQCLKTSFIHYSFRYKYEV